MSREKRIEEIKNVLIHTCKRIRTSEDDIMQDNYAKALYTAGYRKQSEGEWIEDTEYYDDEYSECNVRKVFVCSKCGRTEKRKEPYCNCGAKMKGGE